MSNSKYFDLETDEQKQEFLEKFKGIKFYFDYWYKGGFTFISENGKFTLYVVPDYRDSIFPDMSAKSLIKLGYDTMYYFEN